LNAASRFSSAGGTAKFFYLDWCDRFIKEELRIGGYVRYLDDMALWADSTAELSAALRAVRSFLADRLHLAVRSAGLPAPLPDRPGA
jgi:hypothetical protein